MAIDSNSFFKGLVAKWIESLEIFKWQDFKLFLLGALATFSRSLLILIKYFWWLLLIYLASLFILWGNIFVFSLVFIYSIALFLSFFAILSLRPSIENKNFFYFLNYFKTFFPGFLVIYLLTTLLQIDLYLLSFISIISLFYFDSTGRLEGFFYSFINAFKMILYFFPGFLVLSGVCGIIAIIVSALIFLINFMLSFLLFVSVILWPIFIFLLHLFFLSVWTVYYIKIKHQDFQLFIKE
jgi:hypothetical protein